MKSFKVGGRVRVVQALDEEATYVRGLIGRVGEVLVIDENDDKYPYYAKFGDDDGVWLREDEMSEEVEVR